MIRRWLSTITGASDPPTVASATLIAAQDWQRALAALPFIAVRPESERERLRLLAGGLLEQKTMAGAGGLALTAAIQIHIAAQACVPILHLGLPWYRGWSGIIVYPSQMLVPRRTTDADGVVHEYTDLIAGEAWSGGPVVLSWDDAQQVAGASAAPYNVVIHEFAHQLDQLAGEATGMPPFTRASHPDLDRSAWRSTLADAYERFAAEVELIESELPDDIDPDSPHADGYYRGLPLDAYAAFDEAEFFAVSSEVFFLRPAPLRAAFPAWYQMLAGFYRQDLLQAAT